LWLCRDVTAATEAAASIEHQQELFRLSFEESPVGMAVSRLDGTLIQVNSALAEMLDSTPERLLGSTMASWTHPGDRAVDADNVDALIRQTAKSHTLDKRLVTRDGRTLPVTVIATAVVNRDGPQLVVAHVVPRDSPS